MRQSSILTRLLRFLPERNRIILIKEFNKIFDKTEQRGGAA